MAHGWSAEIERRRGRDRLAGTWVCWRSAAVAGNGVRVQGRSSEVAGGGRGWKDLAFSKLDSRIRSGSLPERNYLLTQAARLSTELRLMNEQE